MSVNLDLSGDFETVVDGATSVVLQRKCGHRLEMPALRAQREAREQAGVVLTVAEWQFRCPEGMGISVGDSLIEPGLAWEILELNRPRVHDLVRCVAIADPTKTVLTDRVDVEQLVMQASSEESWQLVRGALSTKIQLLESRVDHTNDPPSASKLYRLLFASGIELDGRQRLRDAKGRVFRVDSFHPAGSAGPLAEVGATLQVDTS